MRWATLGWVAAGLAVVGVVALHRSGTILGPEGDPPPPSPRERFAVYINEDDWPTIALLPGIGEVLARRIVSLRRTAGPFRSPEDLLAVKGIGWRRVRNLKPMLHFGSRPRR